MPGTLKKIIAVAAGALLLAAFAATIAYAVIEPNSAIGLRLFRLRYDTAGDKSSFLEDFSGELTQFEGGGIPSAIDAYLVRRFNSANSDPERTAIADFYVRQQRRGRPGHLLHEMGEPFAAHFFERLSEYDAKHRLAALAAIEGCRRADSIGKFYFTPLAFAIDREQLSLETVVGAYERWWRSSLPWHQKLSVNPIAELRYDWSEP